MRNRHPIQPFSTPRRPKLCLALGLVLLGPAMALAEETARADAIDDWQIHQSENFRVCCRAPWDPAQIAAVCESLRVELSRQWLGEVPAAWNEVCHVVFHTHAGSYLRAVGRGGEQTLGCATVSYDEDRVSFRRLDVRGDLADPLLRTVPHELTHIVVADRFVDVELPRWADEGIAVLADPAEKQREHHRDLLAAWNGRGPTSLGELFTRDELAFGNRRGAFYGQSASVVGYLVNRSGPARFLNFVHQAASTGYDAALREHYGIGGTRELERHWRSFAAARPEHRAIVDSREIASQSGGGE